jgi:F-type H+-transporting ATPase subunit delta
MEKKTFTLIEQYAKSLVEVALEKGSLAVIQSETESLISVYETTNLNNFLSSPAVSHDERVKLVKLLQESSSEYMSNFLEVILQNEREVYLYQILIAVLEEISVATNEYDVLITTAIPLSEEQRERILSFVQGKFGIVAGRLIEKNDESILGGFIISVNNTIIDTSIRSQLQQLKMNLK